MTPCPKHKGFYSNRFGEVMTTKYLTPSCVLRAYNLTGKKRGHDAQIVGSPLSVSSDADGNFYVDLNQHKRAYYEYKNFVKKVPRKLVLIDEIIRLTFGKPRQFLGSTRLVPKSVEYFKNLKEQQAFEAKAIKDLRANNKNHVVVVRPRIKKSEKRFFTQVITGNKRITGNKKNYKLKKSYIDCFTTRFSTNKNHLNQILSQKRKKKRKLDCGVVMSRRSKSKKERVQVLYAARLEMERHRLEYELEKLGYDPSRYLKTKSLFGNLDVMCLEDRLLEQLLPENLARVAQNFFRPPTVKITIASLRAQGKSPLFAFPPSKDPKKSEYERRSTHIKLKMESKPLRHTEKA